MPDLATNWRQLLAQQMHNTGGQPITGQQATALQYGSMEDEAKKQQTLANLGQKQQQIDNQKAYQTGEYNLGLGKLDYAKAAETARAGAFAGKLALDTSNAAEKASENASTLALKQTIFDTVVPQWNLRYDIKQQTLSDQADANRMAGYAALPIGGLMVGGIGKMTGVNDYIAKQYNAGKT